MSKKTANPKCCAVTVHFHRTDYDALNRLLDAQRVRYKDAGLPGEPSLADVVRMCISESIAAHDHGKSSAEYEQISLSLEGREQRMGDASPVRRKEEKKTDAKMHEEEDKTPSAEKDAKREARLARKRYAYRAARMAAATRDMQVAIQSANDIKASMSTLVDIVNTLATRISTVEGKVGK